MFKCFESKIFQSVSPPPGSFLCPITHYLMEHPMATVLGHTYEYAAFLYGWKLRGRIRNSPQQSRRPPRAGVPRKGLCRIICK